MSELSKELNIPERSLRYQFSNGSIPFVLVNRVAKALNLTIEELVGQGLASDWEAAYSETKGANKPRGKRIATIQPTEKKNSERVPSPAKKPKPAHQGVIPHIPKEPDYQGLNLSALKEISQELTTAAEEDDDDIKPGKLPQISDDLFRTSMA